MNLNYDPLWDEQGRLRQGCTVREALDWLTKYGSHSAGEDVCINGVNYKLGSLLYGPRRKKLRPLHFRLTAKIPLCSVPSSSPHRKRSAGLRRGPNIPPWRTGPFPVPVTAITTS